MKRIAALLMCLWLTCNCGLVLVGGGVWYAGQYYHHRWDAYQAYSADCQAKGVVPRTWDEWKKTY